MKEENKKLILYYLILMPIAAFIAFLQKPALTLFCILILSTINVIQTFKEE
jgi:hypothetical protein